MKKILIIALTAIILLTGCNDVKKGNIENKDLNVSNAINEACTKIEAMANIINLDSNTSKIIGNVINEVSNKIEEKANVIEDYTNIITINKYDNNHNIVDKMYLALKGNQIITLNNNMEKIIISYTEEEYNMQLNIADDIFEKNIIIYNFSKLYKYTNLKYNNITYKEPKEIIALFLVFTNHLNHNAEI